MQKILFTQQDGEKLMSKIVESVLDNTTFNAQMGVNHNIVDLVHNVSMHSLKQLLAKYKKEMLALQEGETKWIANANSAALESITAKHDTIDLVYGYRLFKEAQAMEEDRRKAMLKEYNQLKSLTETPELKLQKLAQQLAEMGITVDEPVMKVVKEDKEPLENAPENAQKES